MDRIQDSGSCDVGSNPAGVTGEKVTKVLRMPKVVDTANFQL